jgi:hypothetical protein
MLWGFVQEILGCRAQLPILVDRLRIPFNHMADIGRLTGIALATQQIQPISNKILINGTSRGERRFGSAQVPGGTTVEAILRT